MGPVILQVNHLSKSFTSGGGLLGKKKSQVQAVKDVSFDLRQGESLGIVGESGSGKSTLARCLMGLYPDVKGEALFLGHDLLKMDQKEEKILRRDIQMIFQDPYSSLNPRMKAGQIIGEPLKNLTQEKNLKDRVLEVMEKCGLGPHHYDRYPHEFSGGQRQRIAIARALVVSPKLIIADEPTSALDVSIQAQIINLLEDLQEDLGLSYIFISHDLAVVEHISDRVGVMYLGQLVELADKEDIYQNPQHDYTKNLLKAIPINHPRERRA
ncbi:MAG: ATP-binding cassette domain-containing protein [Tissierellia bacterium]|nr:ATP-binding cassette domain-containing protein [Tissierellia bacterium]